MDEANKTNDREYQETWGNELPRKRVKYMESFTNISTNDDQPNQESRVSVLENMVNKPTRVHKNLTNKPAMLDRVKASKPVSSLNINTSSKPAILDKILSSKSLRMDQVNSRKPDWGKVVELDKRIKNKHGDATENWNKLLLLEQRLKESRHDNKSIEKNILFQKERIRRYKKKLDLALKEKNMAKEEMIQFKKDTYKALENKNTETTDYIKSLKTEVERLSADNQNIKTRQLKDAQTRDCMEADEADLKHRITGLESEVENKDGIILQLKFAQSQETENNRLEMDGLLYTISVQESEVNSLKAELAQANLKLKNNVNKTHQEILEHQDKYEDVINKLLTTFEAIKADNHDKEKMISGQRDENNALNTELCEVKEALKRVEAVLAAEQENTKTREMIQRVDAMTRL